MAFTNAQLAQKMANLIDYWGGFAVDHAAWLSGAEDGGPNSDGQYELADWQGVTRLVKSPARLQADVDSLVAGAAGYSQQAQAALSQAIAEAATATTQAGLADTARIAAEQARTDTLSARDVAVDARVTAVAQANLATSRASYAQAWAESLEPVSVAAGGDGATTYGAKYWAQLAESFTGDINTSLYTLKAGDETITGAWNFSQAISAPNLNVSDWDTAHGWGNHASAGYLTSLPTNLVTTDGGQTFAGNLYAANNQQYALDLNNGDIVGLNSLIWKDTSQSAVEGIVFSYTGTTLDAEAHNTFTSLRVDEDKIPRFWDGTTDHALIHSGGGQNIAGTLQVNSGPLLSHYVNGVLQLDTDFGYLRAGPNNTGHCHFYTDLPDFYFSVPLEVEDAIHIYGSSTTVQEGLGQFITTAATSAYVRAANSEGGWAWRADSGNAYLYQTSPTGSNENIWIYCVKDSSVYLRYDDSNRLQTTSAGISITGSWYATSDIRHKENIRKADPSLDPATLRDKLVQIEWLLFDWKEGRGEKDQVGVIAQEIQKILPEAVVEDDEGFLTVEYQRIYTYWAIVNTWQEERLGKLEEVVYGQHA